MEHALHQQIKALFSKDQTEVRLGSFRIDAIRDGELIEIQCAALGALRQKIPILLRQHQVRVVKPLVATKMIVKFRYGKEVSRRRSPAKAGWLHLFDELVSFVRVFPSPGLILEALLIDTEEHRRPPTRKRRRRQHDTVFARHLLAIHDRREFRTADDLAALLPEDLPVEFTSADVAQAGRISRSLAQKVLYCLRQLAVIEPVARKRQGWIYAKKAPRTAAVIELPAPQPATARKTRVRKTA